MVSGDLASACGSVDVQAVLGALLHPHAAPAAPQQKLFSSFRSISRLLPGGIRRISGLAVI